MSYVLRKQNKSLMYMPEIDKTWDAHLRYYI